MQEIMPFISKHPILSISWVALLVAVIVLTVKSKLSNVKEVVRGEAIRLINKEDAVVVDIRNVTTIAVAILPAHLTCCRTTLKTAA